MNFVSVFTLRLLAVGAVLVPICRAQTTARPNVIVIVANDLRWDETGYAGHPFVKTPHIDRLARDGAHFLNAFVTVPDGAASFAALLNGRHPAVAQNGSSTVAETAFPRVLRDGGYRTAFVGHGALRADELASAGFGDWVYSEGAYHDPRLRRPGGNETAKGCVTDVLVEHATRFIQQKHASPYCLVLAHPALQAGAAGDKPAVAVAERHRHLYADKMPRRRPGAEILKRPAAGGAAKPVGDPAEDEFIRNRWRALAAIDDGVGRIVEAVSAAGGLGNTIIVFTSDQGYLYGEHRMKGPAMVAYEEAIRVPLVVHYTKAVKRGAAPTNIVLNIDIAPTVLEFAGIAVPPAIAATDGMSFAGSLRGQPGTTRFSFLIEGAAVPPGGSKPMRYQAVRTPAWKYIRFLGDGGGEELYDLHADHYELINLAPRHTARHELRRWGSELAKVLKPLPAKK